MSRTWYWIAIVLCVVVAIWLRANGLYNIHHGHYADQRRSYYLAQGIGEQAYMDTTLTPYVNTNCQIHLGTGEPVALYDPPPDDRVITAAYYQQKNTMRNVAVRTVADNGNSLLYNVGLHLFLQGAGNGLQHARLFSFVWGMLLLLGLWLMFRQLGAPLWVTACGIAWAALHPQLVQHSQIHRATMMTVALIAFGTAYLLWLTKRERPLYAWCGLGLLAAAILLTHYMAVVSLAGWGWLLWSDRWRPRYAASVALAKACCVVPFGLWYAWGGKAGLEVIALSAPKYDLLRSAWNDDYPNMYIAPFTPATFIVAQAQTAVYYLGSGLQHMGIRLMYQLPLLLLATAMFGSLLRKPGTERRLAIAAATPLVLLVAIAWRADNVMFLSMRYVPLQMVLLVPVVAYSIANAWQQARYRWFWRPTAVCLLLLPAAASMPRLVSPRPTQTSYQEERAAQQIAATAQPGDTVVVRAWDFAAAVAVHLPTQHLPFVLDTTAQADVSLQQRGQAEHVVIAQVLDLYFLTESADN